MAALRLVLRLPTSNTVATPTAIASVATAAEELEYWGVSVHDHLVFNGGWVACGASTAPHVADDRCFYEALTTLAYVAGLTHSVKLITAVLLPTLREPILAARQIASLDRLSDGRMYLGVGIGAGGTSTNPHIELGRHETNARHENATFGVTGHRGRLADDKIDLMRALWTGETVDWNSKYTTVQGLSNHPTPIDKRIPILVGGASDAALKRVARVGDGWLGSALTPEEIVAGRRQLSKLFDDANRDDEPEIALNTFCVVATTDSAARQRAYAELGARFPDNEQLKERNLIGTPATIAARIDEYRTAGVNTIEFKPVYDTIEELFDIMDSLAGVVEK